MEKMNIESNMPIEIANDVTYAADEEDITSDENNLLKFKDRTSTNGMGYKILRMGEPLKEQMSLPNTIYEVRYNFNLEEDESLKIVDETKGRTEYILTMEIGCVLKFTGGRFIGGIINGSNTTIDAPLCHIFQDVYFKGAFSNSEFNPEWFGVGTNKNTNHIYFNYAITALSGLTRKTLVLNTKYLIIDTICMRHGVSIIGKTMPYYQGSDSTAASGFEFEADGENKWALDTLWTNDYLITAHNNFYAGGTTNKGHIVLKNFYVYTSKKVFGAIRILGSVPARVEDVCIRCSSEDDRNTGFKYGLLVSQCWNLSLLNCVIYAGAAPLILEFCTAVSLINGEIGKSGKFDGIDFGYIQEDIVPPYFLDDDGNMKDGFGADCGILASKSNITCIATSFEHLHGVIYAFGGNSTLKDCYIELGSNEDTIAYVNNGFLCIDGKRNPAHLFAPKSYCYGITSNGFPIEDAYARGLVLKNIDCGYIYVDNKTGVPNAKLVDVDWSTSISPSQNIIYYDDIKDGQFVKNIYGKFRQIKDIYTAKILGEAQEPTYDNFHLERKGSVGATIRCFTTYDEVVKRPDYTNCNVHCLSDNGYDFGNSESTIYKKNLTFDGDSVWNNHTVLFPVKPIRVTDSNLTFNSALDPSSLNGDSLFIISGNCEIRIDSNDEIGFCGSTKILELAGSIPINVRIFTTYGNISDFSRLLLNPEHGVPYHITLIQGKGSKVDHFTNTSRPSIGVPVGYLYFDKDISKLIVWTGTNWVETDSPCNCS